MIESNRLAQLARDPRIPTPPAVAMRVLEKASRPDCTLADLSKLIARDPGLCIKILGMINSALFGLPRAITSVDRALQLLGLQRVRSLVLALSLPAMAHHGTPVGPDFWKGSLVGGLIARELAIRRGHDDPENELVTALLRDVGVLAFLQVCPEQYAQVLASPGPILATQQCELEKKYLGVSHAEVSAHLLNLWHLPEEITEPIRFHHAPEKLKGADHDVLERARVLHFATTAATLNTMPEELVLRSSLLHQAEANFGMSEDELLEFLAPIAKQTADFAALLKVDVGPLESYEDLLNRSTAELTKVAVETSLENLRLSQEKTKVEEDRARVEAALSQTEERLRQTQKLEALGRLAGGVAHDFNNLLTAINGYSELSMTMLPATDPVRGFVQEIKRAGERAALLTRRLLAFSRKQVIEPVALDLNEIISDMVKMLRRVIGEHIEVVLSLASVLRPIQGDAGQLEQVLLNLVVNARDAMPRGGTLTIETSSVALSAADVCDWEDVSPGSFARLVVRDTGCGMSEEVLRHLFEPFFTTKEPGKGTGLGLATVYGVVVQSRGHIAVASTPGQGTAFTIHWPHVGTLDLKLGLVQSQRALPKGSETILLVDDEDCVWNVACRVLKSQGYTVLATSDPDEALRISTSYPGAIDLLVTDVIMPGMSGPELMEKMIAARDRLKVLYMSGYSEEDLKQHRIAMEGELLIQKPFGPQVLADKVREVLDMKESVPTAPAQARAGLSLV